MRGAARRLPRRMTSSTVHVHRLSFVLLLASGGCISLNVLEESASGTGSEGGSSTGSGTGAPTTSGGASGGSGGPCDFPGDVQPIFTARCALGGCHAGPAPQLGLDLGEGVAHAALVGVNSASSPGTSLVAPGDPGASLLIQKVGPTPPVGGRMPLGGALTGEEIGVLEQWVAAGAPATESFACGGGGETPEVGGVVLDGEGPVELAVGDVAALAAVVTDGEGEPLPDVALTWRSSDGLTLYVDGVGGLLGVSPGAATVTAVAGGVESAPVAITVVAAAPPAASFAETRGLLIQRCGVAGCHVDGVEPGDLRFDREPFEVWERLVGEPSFQAPAIQRVAPAAPRESYLMHKLALAAPAVGGRMPLGQPPLTAAEAQIVLRWILAGASFGG